MYDFLKTLGIQDKNPGGFHGEWIGSGPQLDVVSPINNEKIASVTQVTEAEYDAIVDRAHAAFLKWRTVPAPKRGELVRQLGVKLREVKKELGALVTLEMGKIRAEGEGEVQEMIDICDFACGLSRQLYGLTMHSERPNHRMYEQWHPLGVVGVISAFNFPVAVWSWNCALAAVCGDSDTVEARQQDPADRDRLHQDRRSTSARPKPASIRRSSRLVVGKGSARSASDCCTTSASRWSPRPARCEDRGYRVAEIVGKRLGRTILELGGNNAIIVTPSRRHGHGDAGDPVRRGRHGRPALHQHPPHHRLHESVKDDWSSGWSRLRDGARSAIRATAKAR